MRECLLSFEQGKTGRRGVQLSSNELTQEFALPKNLQREQDARLPEMAEVDVVRHYTALSKRAYGVDDGFYPLGSCTMKYNPKRNEAVAALPGFTQTHPLQPEEAVQGNLQMMHHLQQLLNEISGMDATSLQPAAGAQGEWAGLQLIRAYHAERKDYARTKVIVPDSAHGTNPASAAMLGYQIIEIPSDAQGYVDVEALREAMQDDVAAFMLTNPNTLGKFEKHILEISDIVHNAGGLLYYDGANMNAIMGVTRPGDMGFDVVHWNLHKTLSTPHGGGGPGSGAMGCKKFLEKYLPIPLVTKVDKQYSLCYDRPHSIGRVKSFYGNFLVTLKAYAYLLTLGSDGIKHAAIQAVLHANYMLSQLQPYSTVEYASPCMHEFVLGLQDIKKETGVTAVDIAKAMMDAGFHPPTMYFPLVVKEALMFEPTETESKETLDRALEAIHDIFATLAEDADQIKKAPTTTVIGRPDEVQAARHPVLRYNFDE